MDLVRRLILIAHNFGLRDEPIPEPLRKELMDGLHFIGELLDSMHREWVIVPRESTSAMRYAWMEVYDENGWNATQKMWNALLAAAPKYQAPPLPEAGEALQQVEQKWTIARMVKEAHGYINDASTAWDRENLHDLIEALGEIAAARSGVRP